MRCRRFTTCRWRKHSESRLQGYVNTVNTADRDGISATLPGPAFRKAQARAEAWFRFRSADRQPDRRPAGILKVTRPTA
ncbi:hypothetical protein GCM10010234_59350 [Streptomyces hawaiiensis]